MGIRIDVRRLNKVYEKGPERIHILRDLDLVVESGRQVAVTGISGAGKSTLLHILGALDHPSDGMVSFDDEPVFGRSERELAALRNRRIGFVFQFHHLLEEFSALENAAMPLVIRGEPRRKALRRAGDVLERVGLADRATHTPAELSGGEQQRVAIARALVGSPDLLLMDEPTGNLDTQTAAGVHALIRDSAAQTGATLVIVTHDPDLAASMQVQYHLQDGRIVA